MMQFPRDFFWGAATSSYQVEGDNKFSDWWEWEERVGKQRSGSACRSYELFKEDFDLAKSLDHNAHRLSVEWGRIEPEEGKFSQEAIKHYIEVLQALKERNIEPIVTLHHFTLPVWLAKKGGWENKAIVKYFSRFTQEVTSVLCSYVRFWATINEPMVYVYHAYILGQWPPQEKSFFKAKRVMDNLLSGHVLAYRKIHAIYKEKGLARPLVGFAKNMQAFEACLPGARNKIGVFLRDWLYNYKFIRRLISKRALDFIGVNYYSVSYVETRGWGLSNLLLDVCEKGHSKLKTNSLGWHVYPQGLYKLLVGLKRFKLPVFILENGICTQDDGQRWDYIREHLKSVFQAMQQGTNVIGYLYWSLLDNFEWDKGFGPRFGLIEVDYITQARKVRESAKKYGEVCRTGILN